VENRYFGQLDGRGYAVPEFAPKRTSYGGSQTIKALHFAPDFLHARKHCRFPFGEDSLLGRLSDEIRSLPYPTTDNRRHESTVMAEESTLLGVPPGVRVRRVWLRAEWGFDPEEGGYLGFTLEAHRASPRVSGR
jgi:hypothetical protein